MTRMKIYFILTLLFFLMQTNAFAQKDSLKRAVTSSTKFTTSKITIEQEQWLRKNYQHLAGIKKDSARTEIRKNFSSISDASVEYMITRAGKLMQEDKQKHQSLVQQMLKSLKTQKIDLTKKLADRERELKRTKDPVKIKSLKDEIAQIKNKIKDLDKEIRYLRETK